MPYIKQEQRKELDADIHDLGMRIEDLLPCVGGKEFDPSIKGILNYSITKLMVQLVGKNISYSKINDLIGVLECCKLELYRRLAAPYEDKKIKENGDVYDGLSI